MHDPDTFDVNPIRWCGSHLELLDQRLLPSEERWVRCDDVEAVVGRIRDLTVRGAPAIGVAAAYGMVLGSEEPEQSAVHLRAARPTAVNLMWAVDQMLGVARAYRGGGGGGGGGGGETLRATLERAADGLLEAEVAACRALGRFGEALVPDGASVLTHCNAGALATGGYGTALGVVRAAVEAGKSIHVWVDETRPVWQGARLTAWELTRAGIPNTLVVDGAAASLMARGRVDVAVVGADRIAANGDVANKIGTYGVALAAAAHGLPFVVAAPVSTIDLDCPAGDAIEIEERDPGEVCEPGGMRLAPPGQVAANPAFDVTPARLVTAIVTERGVARAPYESSLRALLD